jgi:hypothetical protein
MLQSESELPNGSKEEEDDLLLLNFSLITLHNFLCVDN